MPLLQINVTADDAPLDPSSLVLLQKMLNRLPDAAPVVILLHGYGYLPEHDTRCPHKMIYAQSPVINGPRIMPWPRLLGVGSGGAEPLCIALGWPATGSFWRIYRTAPQIGAAVGALVRMIAQWRPETRVDFLAHSLGARVALSSLQHCPEGSIGRMVLLAPAELRDTADNWLACPAGRRAQVLAVTSRENGFFDALVEWLVAPHRRGVRAMAAAPAHRWTLLRIDCPEVRTALVAFGVSLPAAPRRICHWSVYTRAGLFDLYRALLSGAVPFEGLSHALPLAPAPAERLAKRWSRMFSHLPMAEKASGWAQRG